MSKKRKYAVSYELPYVHLVTVGVRAHSATNAISKARRAFDAGTIWDDSAAMPLLADDFCECGDPGAPLQFTAEAVDAFRSDSSVVRMRQEKAARHAAQLLVEAWQRNDARGGAEDWSDLGDAYEAALEALDDETIVGAIAAAQPCRAEV